MSEQEERTGRIAAEERLRRVRIATGEWPSKTWSQVIHEWRLATFGKATPERAFERTTDEWEELALMFEEGLRCRTPLDVAEECADVVIMLGAVVAELGLDLADEIEKKMAKNRARKWHTLGDGTGNHIEEEP